MAWYKGKQRDVRGARPDDEGYDATLKQVVITMDDGTEELVLANELVSEGPDTPAAPPEDEAGSSARREGEVHGPRRPGSEYPSGNKPAA